MLSNMFAAAQPSFIVIDDSEENLGQPPARKEDLARFCKSGQPKEREIIIVDSTEDESEKSLLREAAVYKKIAKVKPDPKKIKLCKRKTIFRLEEIQKIERRPSKSPSVETQSTVLSAPKEAKEIEPVCELAPLLLPARGKDVRMGAKYQSSLPRFEFLNAKSDRLVEILKSKEWDPCLIDPQAFVDCKALIQSILELNYLSDDCVCRLLLNSNYKVEDTVNYVCVNKERLQKEIIDSYAPSDPLFRKTRNSLYNKFLLRKL